MDESMSELEKEAFAGSTDAQCQLGDWYFFSAEENEEQAYVKAAYWYSMAAHHGDVIGQYNLAYQYEHALGIAADAAKAV